MSALVGRQRQDARRHAGAARHAHGAAEVHSGSDEELPEVLLGQEVSGLGQAGLKGNAGGTRDVAGLSVCETERREIIMELFID